jgi:hypothetical protein
LFSLVDKQQCIDGNDEICRHLQDLCNSENIQFALSTNLQMAEKQFNIYGSLPRICFFREGYPMIYSGALSNIDNLQEWFGETRKRLTNTLDDKSFEHDTQASSGSTTGDWFILLYEKKGNFCENIILLLVRKVMSHVI